MRLIHPPAVPSSGVWLVLHKISFVRRQPIKIVERFVQRTLVGLDSCNLFSQSRHTLDELRGSGRVGGSGWPSQVRAKRYASRAGPLSSSQRQYVSVSRPAARRDKSCRARRCRSRKDEARRARSALGAGAAVKRRLQRFHKRSFHFVEPLLGRLAAVGGEAQALGLLNIDRQCGQIGPEPARRMTSSCQHESRSAACCKRSRDLSIAVCSRRARRRVGTCFRRGVGDGQGCDELFVAERNSRSERA